MKNIETKVEERIEIRVANFVAVVHELVSGALSDRKTASDAARIRDGYVEMFRDGARNYGELVELADRIFGKYYSSFRESKAG